MKSWEYFLIQQEKELGAETVDKWLRPLKVLRYDARNLYLEAGDSFKILWFEEHIRQKVTDTFVNNNNKPIKIHLVLAGSQPKKQAAKLSKASIAPNQFQLPFDDLDPYLTLDNFIATENNLLPYKLICKTCGFGHSNVELSTFNPIYLYGASGTGKTHLLMALAQALNQKGLNAAYVRAETFTQHVVSAIRAGEMNIFRQAYRNRDVLILDDVHIFSRKGATQEELFHTFNTLHVSGKQIVLSANCPPSELQMIEPRLISRFEWGIVMGLDPLAGQTLEKMLFNKAQALNFPLHPKVSEFLLQTFTSGAKSLVKALQALVLRSHLAEARERTLSKEMTVPYAKSLLQDLIADEEKSALTPERVIQTIAEYFGIRFEDIIGKVQKRDFVQPRQMAMYFCRHLLKLPYMKIGDIFDKDHSTVMSSVRVIQQSIDQDHSEVRPLLNLLEKQIQNR